MTVQAPDAVDLTRYTFEQTCELGCGRPATVIAKGCMDRQPVIMCNQCLQRGLDLVRKAINMYQRFNKRVMICGDCHRPILNLSTHVEIRRI
jgi:formate-dependent nitrite reductase cytochrome c552 subunit